MLRLRVFGGAAIERNGASVAETAELHKKLALLALVAANEDSGISRDQLAGYLWPESHDEHARAALSQSLYTLRKQLAEPALFVGTRTLRLNPSVIGSDLRDFEQALAGDDPEVAVDFYSAPFLHGFFVSDSVELERWIESKRADLARRWAAAIESLARRGCERGDHAAAAHWWRRLTDTERGNSRTVAGLMAALAAAGDTAGALQVAQSHEVFLRSEFDAPPDPAVSALVKEIRDGRGALNAERRIEPPPRSHAGHESLARPVGNSVHDVDDTLRVGETASAAAAEGGGADRLTRTPVVAPSQSGRAGGRRVAIVATVTGALVAGIALTTFVDRQRSRQNAPALSERRIAVTPFRNETGDSALAFVGRTAVDWVVQGLVQTQLVEVVAPGVREDNLPASGNAARSPNAGLIVRGSYSVTADSLVLQAQIVEAATGRVVRAVGPVSGPRAQPLVAIERLRQQLAGALATRVDQRLSRWSDAASQPASFEAYRAFDEGLTAFFSARDSSGSARAGRLLVHAAALDTTFSLPLVWAYFGFLNASGWNYSAPGDSVLRALESRRERLPRLDRALLDALLAFSRFDPVARYEAFRRVVAIAPNSEWVYKLAEVASELHRFGEADSLLIALDPDAGWMREWRNRPRLLCRVLYEEGRHEEELALATNTSGREPGDPFYISETGRALAALGRKSELLTLVDEALASSPPRLDSGDLLSMMSAARVHGHVDIAVALAERALRRAVAGIDMVDSTLGRARFELLVFEASENWNATATSAKRLIRLDSLRGHHDALPYVVFLEAAMRRGTLQDTARLESKALAEGAARSNEDGWSDWRSEQPLVARAELAALRGDANRTAAVLQEALERNFWDPNTEWGPSERSVFDRVRGDPSLAKLLHVPAFDRPIGAPR